MEIGLGLVTCQRNPDDSRPQQELYDEMLGLGEAAHRVNLDSIWLSEYNFSDDGYLRTRSHG